MQPVNFEIPDLGDPPLLFGPPDLVEGYHALEATERNIGAQTLDQYFKAVDVWYRLLTLHYRAYMRGFPPASGSPRERTAWELRSELLALGLASSKAALDLLLAGYYTPAYATIRHMIETVLVCRFVETWPNEAAAFYRADEGVPQPPPAPKVSTMIRKLKRRYPAEGKQVFEPLHRAWHNMSDGSHPSGIGIVQTRDRQSGDGILGPADHPMMFRDGARPGLIATLLIVGEVRSLHPLDEAWNAQFDALSTSVGLVLPLLESSIDLSTLL